MSLDSTICEVYLLTIRISCSESELRGIFGRFGTVQTCIVNKDKRHAFVKMLSRQDAVAAKQGTEDSRNLDVPLRVSICVWRLRS